ncbi:MAG: signal peptidase I [Promethearchaeota archaeon]
MVRLKLKKKTSKVKKKPISKKRIFIGVFLIIFAFSGSFLIYFIMTLALNTTNPMVVVVSGSMEPNISKGDLLFLKGMDPADIKEGTIEAKNGDIIVYDARGLWSGAPNDPIVHRVVDKIYENGSWFFLTKGDANSYVDGAYVHQSRILGVVCGKIPMVGWVKIFLTETGILIPLLVILSFLLVISIVWDIIKDEEKEEKEEGIKIKRKKVKPLKIKEKEKPVQDIETDSSKKDDFDF